jgi:hypothetical protein
MALKKSGSLQGIQQPLERAVELLLPLDSERRRDPVAQSSRAIGQNLLEISRAAGQI